MPDVAIDAEAELAAEFEFLASTSAEIADWYQPSLLDLIEAESERDSE